MEQYRHEPLDLRKDQIRLLRITIADEPTISCTIQIFERESCPEYEALSYVWGPKTPSRTILLNNKRFEIRDNLWSFFTNARDGHIGSRKPRSEPYRPDYLWIDAICIDQSSNEEKSQQVQSMSRTYEGAWQVVVWLGAKSETSSDGMDFLFEAAESRRGVYAMNQSENPVEFWNLYHWDSFLKAHTQGYEGAKQIFERSYWDRLWIVQEFMLARILILACGDRYVHWTDIALTFSGLVRLHTEKIFSLATARLFSGRSAFESSYGAVCVNEYGEYRDNPVINISRAPRVKLMLCIAIAYFCVQKCEDPRDKVYGLLALVEGEHGITVDYSRPASTVFWDMMAVLTKVHGVDNSLNSGAFLELGRSMGVTGNEAAMHQGRALDNFKSIFGPEDPSTVFAG